MQLNSSSAPRGKEDLRDAVPGEKISDAGKGSVWLVSPYSFSVSLTLPRPSRIEAPLRPSDRPARERR